MHFSCLILPGQRIFPRLRRRTHFKLLGAVCGFLVLLSIPVLLCAGRIQPSGLLYLGAFRLPEVTTDLPAVWDWSGQAMTFYPAGDPNGSDDGFPGSLFMTGLDAENYVSEISIPAPVASTSVTSLPSSATLQPFADVRAGLFPNFVELPRVGIEYLPAKEGQQDGHLYLAWGQHFHEDPVTDMGPTHAWCDTDLAHPETQGAWWVGTVAENESGFIYRVNDYLFAIPDAWASAHAGGRALATGRFRDGGWGGMGPNLLAIAPWEEGDPPPPETELPYTPLLLYSTVMDDAGHRMDDYKHSDAWTGGAWLTSGADSAVVFTGTKGSGYTWYGFYTPDGVPAPPLYPEGAPCVYTAGEIMCTEPDGVTPCSQDEMALCEGAPIEEASRGWWSSRFDAVLLFFDPADLAAVAEGRMESWEPQPYAWLDIDDTLYLNATMADVVMYNGSGNQRKGRLGAPAYDREHGLLYVSELFADDYRPVIHVWQVSPSQRHHSRPMDRPGR